jgi:hypothetical protein
MKIKVEGHPNLKRDKSTGAIIDSNNSAYQNYLIRKSKNDAEKNEIENMKNDIDQLKSDIGDIKNLLLKLVEK